MSKESIAIGKLFDDLLKEGYEIQYKKDYELIIPKNIQILTIGNKYVNLVALSRHKTRKHLIKISVETKKTGNYEVTVTTDHVCMIYNDYNFFDNKAAKELCIGDYVSVYDEKTNKEVRGTISKIEDIGNTDDYVYDCEVDDEIHSFYCDDLLIHNSQFVSIRSITEDWISKFNLPRNLNNWSNEKKLELWNHISDFVENTVNVYVQNLTKSWCHTEHPEVLTYALEYVGDIGIYESKKHYAVHKILSEGPEIVNKIKYSGIELKKASVPVKIKEYLGEIYKNTLTNDWKENNFKDYLRSIFAEFESLDVNDISFWKGYTTYRESDGFLHMKKKFNEETGKSVGDTAISTAVTYYNQLLKHLNIASKYDTIRLGDKVRFCYIKPDNKFGIKYIAFKDGQYPDEFRKMFEIDYVNMWDKLINNPLKNFLIATKFNAHGNFNPSNMNIINVDDL